MQTSAHLFIVNHAEHFSIPAVKLHMLECDPAAVMHAHEALGVPRLAHRGYHPPERRLATPAALHQARLEPITTQRRQAGGGMVQRVGGVAGVVPRVEGGPSGRGVRVLRGLREGLPGGWRVR